MKDKQHLVRMAGLFAAGIAVFVILQTALVPKTFGLLGHYRADAIIEETRKPLAHAGRAACGTCHDAVIEAQKAGKHAALGCEGCHGPLLRHALDPARAKPAKLDTKKLCPACHEMNIARPEFLKQVNVAEHSSGEACNTCHQPHAPQM